MGSCDMEKGDGDFDTYPVKYMMQRKFPLAVRFTAMPKERKERRNAQSHRIDAILTVCLF